jgi:hypothetical protein
MKYITVKLTEDQARFVVTILEQDLNPDYSDSDPFNAFTLRIVNKLRKTLVQAKS